MTFTYYKVKEIQLLLLNRIAESFTYDWWDEKETLEYITRSPEEIAEERPDLTNLRIYDLAQTDCLSFGFLKWPEPEVFLIPLYLLPFIKEDTETMSISGETLSKISEIPTEDRIGKCVTYGLPSKSLFEKSLQCSYYPG